MSLEWLYVPNLISLSRIIASCIFLVVLALADPFFGQAFIFLLIASTDFLDGYLARKWNQITGLGKMLDPLADKILVCGTLLVLYEREYLSWWATFFAVLLILREFSVTVLRKLLCNIILPSSISGKFKMMFEVLALAMFLMERDGTVFLGIAVFLAGVSLINYTCIAFKYAHPETPPLRIIDEVLFIFWRGAVSFIKLAWL